MMKNNDQCNNNGEPETPRFWLTGKLYCGKCGEPLLEISGTSKSKKIITITYVETKESISALLKPFVKK